MPLKCDSSSSRESESPALIGETLDNDVSDGVSDDLSVKHEFFLDLCDPRTHVRILVKEWLRPDNGSQPKLSDPEISHLVEICALLNVTEGRGSTLCRKFLHSVVSRCILCSIDSNN